MIAFCPRGVALLRLTEEEDMTTQRGLDYARTKIQEYKGRVVLFGALPCTWGSGWQNLQRKRLVNNPKYQARMSRLYDQFQVLIRNYLILAALVVERGGDLIFEWPTGNKLWREGACN